MAPNKLENQFKEILNARQIKPSAQSWNKLDAMLSASEEKKAKKSYAWFFVAASLLFFFGLGFFLFNSNQTPTIDNSNTILTTINEEIDSVVTNKTNEISVEKVQQVLVHNEVKKRNSLVKNKSNEVQTQLLVDLARNLQPETCNPKLEPPIIYKYISPDDLLAEVQTGEKVITSEKKIISKPKIKVDANSLLTTVEKELDETHRETTLDKLTRKLQDAKSAIANRNYE